MNSLRVKFATILIGSIALVVVLSTLVVVLVTRHLGAEAHASRLARQLGVVMRVAEASADPARFASLLSESPAPGELQAALTQRVHYALQQDGRPVEIRIASVAARHSSVASLEIAPGRWLTVPIEEEPPPPDAWLVIGGWMSLILLGTAAIALGLARRVTRPLALLESFASEMSPGGATIPVPEDGPAEVRATAQALNRLNQKLREVIESRMRLVAAAGHDLRTPLTRMRLRAEFLDETERPKWLANIDELERIADSAILLVREEIGDAERQTIRLDLLAEQIVTEVQALKLPAEITSLSPTEVVGSPLSLTRAIRNLTINAATHGGGAEILVEERGGWATLIISDHGPGIPDHLLGRVFEPFFRADAARRQSIPGAGLGLAIAHESVTKSGGSLILRNRMPNGLEQKIRLPVKQNHKH